MHKYLNYKEAAHRLGVSYPMVRRYVKDGLLGQKYPHGYRITEKDVREFQRPRRGRPKKVLAS